MVKIKALILIDYVRPEYFNKQNKLDFVHSSAGKEFIHAFNKYNLKLHSDYEFKFYYPNIPIVSKYNKYNHHIAGYKPLNKSQLIKANTNLSKILKDDYDIIIPTGSYSVKRLFGHTASIMRLFAHDKLTTINNKQYLVMPIYNQELVNMDYSRAIPRSLAIRKLALYLKGYWSLNYSRIGNYYLLDTVDKVRQVLAEAKKHTTAWDTETNSKDPDWSYSRILCMTLSYMKDKKYWSYYIPLGHRQSPFNSDQLEQVKKLIKDFIDSPNIKVAHNSRFDTNWLLARGISRHALNVRDTKIGYWLLVDQSVKESLRLTDLSWLLTPMGGYDTPLETFKNWIIDGIAQVAYGVMKKKAKANKVVVKRLSESNIRLDDSDKKIIIDDLLPDNMEKNQVDKLLSKAAYNKALALSKQVKDFGFMTRDILEDIVNIVTNNVNKYFDPKNVKRHFSYDWFPLKVMFNYSVGDAESCLRIYQWELKAINKSSIKTQELFKDFYPKFVFTLAKIQNDGAYINTDYTKVLQRAYTNKCNELLNNLRSYPDVKELENKKDEIFKKSLIEKAKPSKDRDKNIFKFYSKYKHKENRLFKATDADKRILLFDIMGLKVPHTKDFYTKKGAISVGKDTIEYLLDHTDKKDDKHVLLETIRRYTKVQKIENTFADAMLTLTSDKDHCVHAIFNETGTATSRISGSKPDLQNQPAHITDVNNFLYKYPIKRQFESRFSGGVVFNCDYSNLELRILGLLSEDPNMYETFITGKDIHKATASGAFNVPYDEVLPDQRQAAKRVSFGIIYGIGAQGLSKQIGCSEERAQEFMDKYLDSKPAVRGMINTTNDFGLKHGYVETMPGFRRYIFEMFSKNKYDISAGIRKCNNTRIQGSGAFLTNSSLIYIEKYLMSHNLKSKVALTVHDSVFGDVYPTEIKQVLYMVKYIMTHLPLKWLFIDKDGKRVRYPIDAEMQIGLNYNDLVSYDPKDFETFNSPKGYIQYYLDQSKLDDQFDSKVINEDTLNEKKQLIIDRKGEYQSI